MEEYIKFESKHKEDKHTKVYVIKDVDINALDLVKAFTEFALGVGYNSASIEAAMRRIVEETELLC